MTRPSWDETWMAVAETIAARSGCARSGVGAVIVTSTNRIVATGYNGPPAGLDATCADCPRRPKESHDLDPVYDDCIAVHAEMNALMFVDRTMAEGGTLYVTGAICFGCAKAVANSGLARVVCRVRASESYRNPDRSLAFLRDSGLTVDPILLEHE